MRARRVEFLRDSLLAFLYLLRGSRTRILHHGRPVVQGRLAPRSLLRINLIASFLDGVAVGVQFLLRGGLSGGGFGARAVDARRTFGHSLGNRGKKGPAHEKQKDDKNDDGGHSLEEQLSDLMGYGHRL